MAEPLTGAALDQALRDSTQDSARRRQVRAQVTPSAALSAVSAASRNPSAGRGIVGAAAATGSPAVATGPAAAEIAMRNTAVQVDEPGAVGQFFGFIGSGVSSVVGGAKDYVVMPAVRGGILAADFAYHEVIDRPITSLIEGATSDKTIGEVYSGIGASPGLVSTQRALSGDFAGALDLGEGFLPGGGVAEESERRRTFSIDGGRANLQRAIASNTVGELGADPGSFLYRNTEILFGVASAVTLDPVAGVAGGFGKAGRAAAKTRPVGSLSGLFLEEGVSGLRRATQSLDRVDRGVLQNASASFRGRTGRDFESYDELLDELVQNGGGIKGSWRQSVLVDQLKNTLDNPKVLQPLADMTTYEIYNALPSRVRQRIGKPQGMSASVLEDLGKASNPEEVKQALLGPLARGEDLFVKTKTFAGFGTAKILTGTLGTKRASVLARMSETRGLRRVARFADMSPAGFIDLNDPLQAAVRLDGIQRQTLNVPYHIREERFNRMISRPSLNNPDDRELLISKISEFTGIAEDRVLDLPPDELNELTNVLGSLLRRESISEIVTDVVADIGTDVFSDAKIVNLAENGISVRTKVKEIDNLVDNGVISKKEGRRRWREFAEAHELPGGGGKFRPKTFLQGRNFRQEVREVIESHRSFNKTVQQSYGFDEAGRAIGGAGSRPIGTYVVEGGLDDSFTHIDDANVLFEPRARMTSDLAEPLLYFDEDSIRRMRIGTEKSILGKALYKNLAWDFTSATMRTLTRDVFKPLVLLRPAYFSREFIDATSRQAAYAAPVDTLLTNPFAYMGAVWNMRNRGIPLDDVLGMNFREMAVELDLMGQSAQRALTDGQKVSARVAGMQDYRRPNIIEDAEGNRTFRDGEGNQVDPDEFFEAWYWEMRHFDKSPELRELVRLGGDEDRFIQWVNDTPEGTQFLDNMADRIKSEDWVQVRVDMMRGNDSDFLRQWVRDRKVEMFGGEIAGRKVEGRFGGVGNGLEEMLTEGRIFSGRLGEFVETTPENRQQIIDILKNEYADLAPSRARSPFDLSKSGRETSKLEHFERLRTLAANKFMTEWSNKYVRIPALRKFHVNNTRDLLTQIEDKNTREMLISLLADDLSMSKKELKDFEKIVPSKSAAFRDADYGQEFREAVAQRPSRTEMRERLQKKSDAERKRSGLPPEEVTEEAVTKAINARTKALIEETELVKLFNEFSRARTFENAADTFFNLSGRSAIQENFDIISPFYDAYVEGIRTFSRLFKENPAFFVRAQGAYSSLRDSGFIYADDNGQEVFAIPALGGLIRRLSGIPGGSDVNQDFELPIGNLNSMVQSVLPGFGPVVQWGVGAFIEEAPSTQELHNLVNPFGSPLKKGPLQALSPAYGDKFMTAVLSSEGRGRWDEQLWNSTFSRTLKGLMATGMYKEGDPDENERLIADATKATKWTLVLRAGVQFVAPATPTDVWKLDHTIDPEDLPLEWDTELDPDATTFTMNVMRSAYFELRDQYDDQADEAFTQVFGMEPWYIIQGRSYSRTGVPATLPAAVWQRANQDVVDKYPFVAGYFAPEGSEDDFHPSVWADQVRNNDRVDFTPQQMVVLSQHTKARSRYYAVRDQLEKQGHTSRQASEILRPYKQELINEFGDWTHGSLFDPNGVTNADKVFALKQAAFDPLLNNQAGHTALNQYMQVREEFLRRHREEQGNVNIDSLSANYAALSRDALRTYGSQLAQTDDNFANMWVGVLSREVQD